MCVNCRSFVPLCEVSSFQISSEIHSVSITGKKSVQIRDKMFNEKSKRQKFIQTLLKYFRKLLTWKELNDKGMFENLEIQFTFIRIRRCMKWSIFNSTCEPSKLYFCWKIFCSFFSVFSNFDSGQDMILSCLNNFFEKIVLKNFKYVGRSVFSFTLN